MTMVLAPLLAAYQRQQYALNLNTTLHQSKSEPDYSSGVPQASAHLAPQRRAIAVQTAILAAVVAACALAPRPGQAAIYLPLIPARHHAALDWAIAHGASIIGTGPAGGLILGQAPAGLAMRAAAEGALVLAVPPYLCSQSESSNHG